MAGQTLDLALTGDGGELTLTLEDGCYAMRVDRMELMTSTSHRSEERLAVHGCAGLADVRGARVFWSAGWGWDSRPARRWTAWPPTPS